MADELAHKLVEQRVVSSEAMQEALQRQVVQGGGLDTNLLEAGAVEEAELVAAMGEVLGLPVADRSDIDGIAEHLPRLFPLVFAETYHMVPYRLVGQNLGVLVSGAPDPQLYARIEERLKLHVRPTLTSEVRLRYAMHSLYGTDLLPRFRTLLEKLDGELPEPGDAEGSGRVLSWGLPTGTPPPAKPKKRGKLPPFDVDGMLQRLAGATDRDTVVDVLIEAMLTTFEFASLFSVQGDRVNGWRAMDLEATQRIARISLPVELPSVFQTIYATHAHYLGRLPGNSVNLQLIEDMGREAPRTALLAPILVGGKLAAILYGDNGNRGVPSKRVASILLLSNRAGLCLQGLIQKRKAAAAQETVEETATPDTTPDAEATHEEDGPVMLGDDDFEPLVEAPPPLPPRSAAEEEPIVGADDEDEEEEEEDSTALWQSVEFEDIDSSAATGHFEQDSSAAAASAAFEKGIESSAVEPEPAEPPPEPEPAREEGYVAFSDVDESEEKSVSDWEDVFVETVGTDKPEQAVKDALDHADRLEEEATAPPAVTWEDVVAEASSAPELVAAATTANTVEVAGTMVDEREILLDSLDAADPEIWKPALAKLVRLGSAIDPVLTERFPGNVTFDPFAAQINLPPFSRCSGITALLTLRGRDAAGVVLSHLESNDQVKRFFSIYYLYAVHYPEAIELLARRIYDSEPRNRYLAADALRSYKDEPAYKRIVQGLRDHLKVPVVEAQVATVQVLGQLRDPSCVPSLIPLVVSPRQALARASSSALTVICAQSYGPNVAQWAEWWQTHFNKPREAWLVEGMRHSDADIRRIAAREFQLLTGQSDPAPKKPAATAEAAPA